MSPPSCGLERRAANASTVVRNMLFPVIATVYILECRPTCNCMKKLCLAKWSKTKSHIANLVVRGSGAPCGASVC